MNYNRIVYIRENLELNQREMSKLLNIPKSNYARWESGETIIPLKYLIKLCNISKFSLDFALGLSNDRTKIKKDIKLDYKIIGNNVRKIRLSQNKTQREFAETLNTTHSTINRCENGQIKNLTSFLYELAKTYNISLSKIIDYNYN